MFEIIKQNTKIDFIGWAKVYFIFSAILCVISIALIFGKGFNFGVDFSGGTVVQVSFTNPPSVEDMRTVLDKAVKGNVSIQNFGEKTDFIIKAEQTTEDLQSVADAIQNTLTSSFKDAGTVTIQRVEQVGPQVGKDLKYQAFMAVIYAMIGILIYIALRFELYSSIGSIIALIHDVLITLGVIILCGVTFDLTVLAAVLTVVGYSLNDKVVIFDRIREKTKSDGDKPLMLVMNKSINDTLSRTILTSVATALAVISLMIFGGEVIKGFAITMFAGIIVGTYSSIGIASASVYYMKRFAAKRKATAR